MPNSGILCHILAYYAKLWHIIQNPCSINTKKGKIQIWIDSMLTRRIDIHQSSFWQEVSVQRRFYFDSNTWKLKSLCVTGYLFRFDYRKSGQFATNFQSFNRTIISFHQGRLMRCNILHFISWNWLYSFLGCLGIITRSVLEIWFKFLSISAIRSEMFFPFQIRDWRLNGFSRICWAFGQVEVQEVSTSSASLDWTRRNYTFFHELVNPCC
jgi:hypothetical protein